MTGVGSGGDGSQVSEGVVGKGMNASQVCLSPGVINDGFIVMTAIIRNNGHTSTL